MRIRRLRQLELSERLLELPADAIQRRVRVRRDHRPDELHREADRARLERSQARRVTEGVAVELLVDMHLVALECGVDGVAAAAEVDEIEQLKVLLELLLRNVEAFDDLAGRDHSVALFPAGGEEIGEQSLQDGEALRDDRPGRPFAHGVDPGRRRLRCELRRCAHVALADRAERLGHLPAELVRLDGDRPSVLAEDPGSELRWRRILGDEDPVLELAGVSIRAFHPPGRVAGELDPGLAEDVADLPRRPAAVDVDVEVGRDPEIALAAGCEADVSANARDPERADVLAVEVLANHVPAAVVRQEPVRVEGALALPVAGDRVVRELDGPLLRDRAFELPDYSPEMPGRLG